MKQNPWNAMVQSQSSSCDEKVLSDVTDSKTPVSSTTFPQRSVSNSVLTTTNTMTSPPSATAPGTPIIPIAQRAPQVSHHRRTSSFSLSAGVVSDSDSAHSDTTPSHSVAKGRSTPSHQRKSDVLIPQQKSTGGGGRRRRILSLGALKNSILSKTSRKSAATSGTGDKRRGTVGGKDAKGRRRRANTSRNRSFSEDSVSISFTATGLATSSGAVKKSPGGGAPRPGNMSEDDVRLGLYSGAGEYSVSNAEFAGGPDAVLVAVPPKTRRRIAKKSGDSQDLEVLGTELSRTPSLSALSGMPLENRPVEIERSMVEFSGEEDDVIGAEVVVAESPSDDSPIFGVQTHTPLTKFSLNSRDDGKGGSRLMGGYSASPYSNKSLLARFGKMTPSPEIGTPLAGSVPRSNGSSGLSNGGNLAASYSDPFNSSVRATPSHHRGRRKISSPFDAHGTPFD